MKTINVNQIFSLVFFGISMLFSSTNVKAREVAKLDFNTVVTLANQEEVALQDIAFISDENENTKTLNVRLYRADSYYANSSSSDAFVIHFTRDGDNGIDHRDVPKMNNFDENLARFHSGNLLVIENRAFPEANEQLSLFINQYSTINYVLKFNVPEFDGVRLQLVDAYTKLSHNLSAGENVVNFSLDNSNASRAHNRFSLEFEQVTLNTRNFGSKNAVSLYPNPVNDIYFYVDVPKNVTGDVLIEIFNSQGRKVNQVLFRNRTTHSLKIDSAKLNQGVYYLKVQGNHNLNKTLKFIKS